MRFAFISTMGGVPWGGSEELWSQTATRLISEGFRVSASTLGWPPPHPRLRSLIDQGIDVHLRPHGNPVWHRAWHKLRRRPRSLQATACERFLAGIQPHLVVLSHGDALPPAELMELCIERHWSFVTVGHANCEHLWHDDTTAERYRNALPAARRCYFVADANRRLAEKQIAADIANAEVVRNPFNVPYDGKLPWPACDAEHELRLACVARLHPPSKGHDLLLEALAVPKWRERRWTISLYGEGPARMGIERQAARLGLSDRIRFAGFEPDVTAIWASHHALILPSRYEGLPIALVEAMLCARPVIVTDVAGHSEIVEDGVSGFLAKWPSVPALLRALEQAWDRRGELEAMGQAARKRIRELVPPNPAEVFADKLKQIAQESICDMGVAKCERRDRNSA